MIVARMKRGSTSEATIFGRLWDPVEGKGGLTPALAKHILRIGFSNADLHRMHELAEMNRTGTLTDADEAELDDFVRVGDLLAILHSKARKVLRKVARKANGHG